MRSIDFRFAAEFSEFIAKDFWRRRGSQSQSLPPAMSATPGVGPQEGGVGTNRYVTCEPYRPRRFLGPEPGSAHPPPAPPAAPHWHPIGTSLRIISNYVKL